MRLLSILCVLPVMLSFPPAPISAAGHHEITVIPLGRVEIKAGVQDVDYGLPAGARGPLPQPLVLLAARPAVSLETPAASETPPALPAPADAPDEYRRVAATLNITVGATRLPPWELLTDRTAYVINLDTIRSNPAYASGRIALKIELVSEAPAVAIDLLGMPDPSLLKGGSSTSLDGPLALFGDRAVDPDVKAYFAALAKEVSGKFQDAQIGYEGLARDAANPRVARLARRGLRMLSYLLRKRKLSGNYMEHYRWGLYLQFCGLFKIAFDEFEECRIIDPGRGESQFRAGECLERVGAGLLRYIHYLDRAAEADKSRESTIWYVLVSILKSRGGKTLSGAEIERVKDSWLFVEKMVWAATRGIVRISTSFYEIDSEQTWKYLSHQDRVTGPADDLIETRGWYDSIISVRPRLENEDRDRVEIAGPEVGPNGTAIASVFHDAGWSAQLEAVYGHLLDAAEAGELETGLPHMADVLDCGQPPTPSKGAALRAALRYHFSRDAFRRMNLAAVPVPGSYLQLWSVEGPFKVDGNPAGEDPPGRHVMDALPTGAPKTLTIVNDADFVDLAQLLPGAGWALACASTWVYSPKEQQVRLRLGRNDGMAMWLNGECIHRGRRYAADKFEDRDLVDTVFTAARLGKGWNELRVVVESWPPPRNRGWGFSVSVTTPAGGLVPGLASVYNRPESDRVPAYTPPKVGDHYDWSEVGDDFRHRLPLLSADDLEKISGVSRLHIQAAAKPFGGFVAFAVPDRPASSPRYRPVPASWDDSKDRDIVVNNLMDWAREASAVFTCRAGPQIRQLALVKPEAVDAFLELLKESDAARLRFAGRSVSQRLLGYVVVPFGTATRTLLLVDCLLGDEKDWPLDEEDLLTPFGEFVPNWPEASATPAGAGAAENTPPNSP